MQWVRSYEQKRVNSCERPRTRQPTFETANFKVVFAGTNIKYEYLLQITDKLVTREVLTIDEEILLDRKDKGHGKIYAEKIGEFIEFQSPPSQLAVVLKRDTLQHPFLEALFSWGESVKCYRFGGGLGKSSLTVVTEQDLNRQTNIPNPEQAGAILHYALDDFGEKFKKLVFMDLRCIGYECIDIGLEAAPILGQGDIPQTIFLQEKDLDCHTNQVEMSQGMFRVLSLIIQINYSVLTKKNLCVLIDDIGEGLDFDRSSSLIKLLLSKAEKSLIQLIMTSNDRFAMNGVPINYWSIVKRERNHVSLINSTNSPKAFENFEYIGLNNFDFFAKDLYELDKLD
jgi:hypothetical protein